MPRAEEWGKPGRYFETAAITSGNPLPVSLGGTGATTEAGARTNLSVTSGTYTPTITNGGNVGASTAFVNQWMRIDNVVTVSGRVDIDAVAAGGTLTFFDMSLPIASNFTTANQCGGSGAIQQATYVPISIISESTANAARLIFQSADTVNSAAFFSFTYLIV